MLSSGTPAYFPEIFAKNAGSLTRAIPQTTVNPVEASLDLGFPPATATPIGSGGTPPDIKDFNGILQQTSAWAQWLSAGGANVYNSTFAAAISGYPKGAILCSANYQGIYWRNLLDGNTTNPDNPASSLNWVRVGRVTLLGATTFYVNNASGNDVMGGGLTAGIPYQTLQFAINDVTQLYDFNGQAVTLQLADNLSTPYGNAAVSGAIIGLTSPSNFLIQGNSGAPGNTQVGNILFNNFGMGQVNAMRMAGSYGLSASALGIANLGTNMQFAAMANYQIDCRSNGIINVSNAYSILGGAAAHLSVQGRGTIILSGATGTVSGTPNFGTFALADNQSQIQIGSSSYSGAANGSRYTLTLQSLVTSAGGPNFFPGNSAGTVDASSIYQ